MSRGSNLGRTALAVAAAAGVAGLLTYTPPQTELQTASPTPDRARPIVSGPFTATPASVPFPVDAAPVTTATTAAPAIVPPAVPPVTEPPPPPPTEVAPEPAPPPDVPPPAPRATYAPTYTYTEPEPEPEAAPPDDSGDNCANFGDLLTLLDDPELRTAVSTVGC